MRTLSDDDASRVGAVPKQPAVHSILFEICGTHVSAEIGAVNFDGVAELRFSRLRRHCLAQFVHEHESGLVLNVEVAGELNGGHPLRGVHEHTDRPEEIDEG